MSAYRADARPVPVCAVCACTQTARRRLYVLAEAGVLVCVGCGITPDTLEVLTAVREGHISTIGAEWLIDHRSAKDHALAVRIFRIWRVVKEGIARWEK